MACKILLNNRDWIQASLFFGYMARLGRGFYLEGVKIVLLF